MGKIKRKPKTKKLSFYVKKADEAQSKYIRQRDKACITCGTKEGLTCSHLIRRGRMAIRFSELNTACQCFKCNFRHNYYPEIYTDWFLAKYGRSAYEEMVRESRQVRKWTKEELIEIAESYSLRLLS